MFKKICCCKGFSYVEILVTSALLSIFLIPISLGYGQATKLVARSKNTYIANNLVHNLITEIETSSRIQTIDEFYKIDDIWSFIGCKNPEELYLTDLYDYKVEMKNIVIEDYEYRGNEILIDENYNFNNALIISDKDFTNNIVSLKVLKLTTDLNILVDNKKEEKIFINILHTDSVDINKIKVDFTKNSDLVFVSYSTLNKNLIKFDLSVSMYSKDGKLLNEKQKNCFIA